MVSWDLKLSPELPVFVSVLKFTSLFIFFQVHSQTVGYISSSIGLLIGSFRKHVRTKQYSITSIHLCLSPGRRNSSWHWTTTQKSTRKKCKGSSCLVAREWQSEVNAPWEDLHYLLFGKAMLCYNMHNHGH